MERLARAPHASEQKDHLVDELAFAAQCERVLQRHVLRLAQERQEAGAIELGVQHHHLALILAHRLRVHAEHRLEVLHKHKAGAHENMRADPFPLSGRHL